MSKPLENYIIRIKSSIDQFDNEGVIREGDRDHIELMTRGSFTKKNGSYYISYKETQTIGFEGCTTTIKIAEDGSRVALLRFGRANSQLLIERDRRNLCHYETEVGSLTLGVTGDGIDCKLTEKGGSAAFSYLLDADDARIVSRNTLEMTVQHVNGLLIVFRLRLLRQAGFALKHERTLEMTDFEKTYQNYNPRQTALDEARALLTAAARAAMADGTLPEAELPAFIVEIPADVKNGDIASNIAMAGARTWRKAPKMIADALIAHLPALDGGVFAKVEVAGPGFINLFLAPSFWAAGCLLQQGVWPHRPRQGCQVQRGVRLRQPHRPHAHGQCPRRRSG